jgi:uncharacterized protein (TIGR00288 family)
MLAAADAYAPDWLYRTFSMHAEGARMTEPTEGRVAVYIDFDNIVISRYDQLHGGGQFHKDKARRFTATPAKAGTEVAKRLVEATVDMGAILDFASSFGTIVLSRAYADWSVPVNAGYQKQLIDKAVDLTQLFPTVASMKNGADIRLAVDVVEDLFRLPDLTHVVIVAGDSDYIALAQRAKRLGRYVVGIGVAGGTSKALAAACDEFSDYDALLKLDVDLTPELIESADTAPATAGTGAQSPPAQSPSRAVSGGKKQRATPAADPSETDAKNSAPSAPKRGPSGLLVRALRLGQAKGDVEWLSSSAVKNQMLRMDPSFNEGALGFSKFTDFVKSRENLVEFKEDGQARLIRLRPAYKNE